MTPRDINAMAEEVGVTVVDLKQTRHWKARVRRQDDTEFTIMFPCTPSDHRGLKNKKAQLKRMAQG